MSDSPPRDNQSDQEQEQERSRERGSRDRERRSSRKTKDKDRKRDKTKEDSKRSRSRSGGRDSGRDKKKRSGSRDRDRNKDRDRSRDRDRERTERRSGSKTRDRESGSRSRDRDRRSGSSKRRSRSKSPEPDPEAEEKKRQEAAAKEERELHKDQYTVFVSQIHPKVDERDLFEFFSHVGRVEDIRLIRDQRTQKSKGLCYVEFGEKESVHKAVTLTGQLIGGYPITIVICEDKSRPVAPAAAPLKLYVGQLHLNVSDLDLRPVFEAFGVLDFIDLHKDPVTGTSKGFGFVQFKNDADGRSALESLNGLEIAGKAIKVGIVDQNTNTEPAGGEWEQDENVMLTAQSRAALMQKLTRGVAPPAAPVQQPPSINVPMIQPTTCIIIKNMFDPKTETEVDFDLDIKEDVEEEAAKFGPIKHILVDKNSAGHVYLRFESVAGAEKLRSTMHGRWFASRQISAEFVIEQTYGLKFPESNR